MGYLLLLAVIYSGISMVPWNDLRDKVNEQGMQLINQLPLVADTRIPLDEIKKILKKEAPTLNELVVNKLLTTLKCAHTYDLDHNPILTLIDYSLPSNEKRLWVFDLKEKRLLFNTYVSHGITSGALLTNFFSNKYNSKASSIGIYKTEQSYYGREGLSLRLDGLDAHFNDNAANRSVVMHGGWYVEEPFIKRYGRPGRSWGCPALPLSHYQAIINVIKDNSLLIAYYPNDLWFHQSKFLNCDKTNGFLVKKPDSKIVNNNEPREEVLFANTSKHNMKHADSNPIVAMSANDYERIFSVKAPLERMLRRQINAAEYIALSNREFHALVTRSQQNDKEGLNAVHFVVPVIIMVRGYYETQMRIVNMGTIKDVSFKEPYPSSYKVNFETKDSINLTGTNRFIRWLGL